MNTDNKLYLDYADIGQHCLDIGREIALNAWTPDYIVGLTRGGLLPATLLSHFLDVPMFSLDVSLRDSTALPTSSLWMAEDALDGKHILIVDDINDSGATLNWIVDDWRQFNRPSSPEWNGVFAGKNKNVRIATVVNNEASEFTDVSYFGLEINKIENDSWVVFPWEDWWMSKPKS